MIRSNLVTPPYPGSRDSVPACLPLTDTVPRRYSGEQSRCLGSPLANAVVSTRWASLASTSRGCPSVANTRLLAIAPTSQPRAAAAAAAVGTGSRNDRSSTSTPAARSAAWTCAAADELTPRTLNEGMISSQPNPRSSEWRVSLDHRGAHSPPPARSGVGLGRQDIMLRCALAGPVPRWANGSTPSGSTSTGSTSRKLDGQD